MSDDLRLVVVDFDDTLLSGGVVRPLSVQLLAELADYRVWWCVATGRSTGRLVGYFGELEPTAGWVWSHGALARWRAWSYEALLPPLHTGSLLELVRRVEPGAKVGLEWGSTLYHDRGYPVVRRPERECVPLSREQMAVMSPQMVRVHGEPGVGDRLVAAAAEYQLPVRCWPVGSDAYVEVTAESATKLLAVQRLAAELGVDRSQVAMIGDGVSDVELLSWAGRSVAMRGGHACAVAAAQAVADDVDEALSMVVDVSV